MAKATITRGAYDALDATIKGQIDNLIGVGAMEIVADKKESKPRTQFKARIPNSVLFESLKKTILEINSAFMAEKKPMAVEVYVRGGHMARAVKKEFLPKGFLEFLDSAKVPTIKEAKAAKIAEKAKVEAPKATAKVEAPKATAKVEAPKATAKAGK